MRLELWKVETRGPGNRLLGIIEEEEAHTVSNAMRDMRGGEVHGAMVLKRFAGLRALWVCGRLGYQVLVPRDTYVRR